MSVIVTNSKNRIAYAITRCLAGHGIDVVTADSISTPMTRVSRHSSGYFSYPSPYRDERGFVDCLIRNCAKVKCEVLIPVYEETFVVAKYRKEIGSCVNLLVPEYDAILMVHDKQALYRTAESLGIPTPRGYPVSELEKSPHLSSRLRFPVLVKPRQGGGAWGMERVRTERELREMVASGRYPGGLPGDRFVVQEVITGRVSCCGMLMKEGAYRAGYCYRQVRETPLAGGTATYRESILAPEIMGHFQRLLEHLSWNGVCQADFIVDDVTGTPYLIDVNPRFWGSLHQAIISGVEFPYYIYELAQGRDIAPVREYETRYRSRWLGGDLKCFLEYIRNRGIRPDIALTDFFRISADDRYDDFEWSDPLPFTMWFVDYCAKMIKQRSLSPSPHDSKEGIWE